jgi:glycosyltransferase involved in cell wall biosynthesis
MPCQGNCGRTIFSIVLPTCDREHMLRRAVASVLRQTLTSFELIVVDDGPGRSDLRWLSELSDQRIRLIRNPRPMGVAAARNVGIEAATGEYVAFLDDDDEYLTLFLNSTYEHLKNTPPDVGMSWCGIQFIDYPPNADDGYTIRETQFSLGPSDNEMVDNVLSIGAGFGVTLKMECLDEIRGFNPALKTVEDIDLFLRVLVHGYRPIVVPDIHVVVHNHRSPRLTDTTLHSIRVKECRWLLNEYESFIELHPHIRTRLDEHISLLETEMRGEEAQALSSTPQKVRRKGWPSMGRWLS